MYKVDRGGESRRVVSTFLSLFFFLLTFWVLKARKPHKWTPCPYERPTTRRHRSRLILCTTYYHYYYYYYNLLLLRVVLLVVLRKCTLYKQAWKKEGKPVVEGKKNWRAKICLLTIFLLVFFGSYWINDDSSVNRFALRLSGEQLKEQRENLVVREA